MPILSEKEEIMHGLVRDALDGVLDVGQAAAKAGVCERTIHHSFAV